MCKSAIFLLGMLFSISATAQLTIDDFSTDQSLASTSMVTGTTTGSVSGGGLVGGARDVRITNINTTMVSVDISSGTLVYDSNGLADLEVNYDGSADNMLSQTGLGGVDLTNGGSQDRFVIDVLFSNSTGDATLRVRDSNANLSERVFNLVTVPSTIELTYASFTGAADFSDVDNVSFDLRTRDGAENFGLRFVQTTPVELLEFDIH